LDNICVIIISSLLGEAEVRIKFFPLTH